MATIKETSRTAPSTSRESYALIAAKLMRERFGNANLNYAENSVKVRSALGEDSRAQIELLAREIAENI